MLEGIRNAKKRIGLKQSMKALQTDEVDYLIVAKDADMRVIGDLLALGNQKNITIHYVDTMKQLGKAAGIGVGASVVAILK